MDKLNLKVKKTPREANNELELAVEAPSEISDKAYSLALRNISNEIDVPGFRKGKAPKDIIEGKVGKGYISQRAFEKVFYDLLFDVAINEKLDIVDVVEILSYELLPGKPVTFKAVVELKSDVKLGKYKSLKVKVKKVVYDRGEFINQTLLQLSGNLAAFKKVSDRGVKEGDLIIIDFESKFEDGTDVPGGKAENFQALLEKDKFLPEFVDQLVSTKIDETREVKITFPEAYHKDFAGKKANFKVKIIGIEEREIPEINDDLAKKVGVENLEQLKVKVESQMIDQQNFVNHREFENGLVEEIIQNSEYKISQRMLNKEVDFLLNDFRIQCQKDEVDWESFKSDPKNKELIQKAKEAAEKRIAIDLILGALIKNEKIAAVKEEIDLDVKSRILQLGEKYKHLENDKKFRTNIELVNLRNKAIDFLLKHNEAVWEEEKQSVKPKK